jgi:hypothetical protein
VFIAFAIPFLSVLVLGVHEEDVDVARIDACFCKRTLFHTALLDAGAPEPRSDTFIFRCSMLVVIFVNRSLLVANSRSPSRA